MSCEYAPAEDTFLLCRYIDTISGDSALEVGSGSGFVTKLLERRFGYVACTDIDHRILREQTHPAQNRICCHAADAIRYKFDVIVSNPPYLDTEDVRFGDTDGGPGGVSVPISFLHSMAPRLKPDGHIAMVISSLSRLDILAEQARRLGMLHEIAMRQRLFFEELYVVRMAYR